MFIDYSDEYNGNSKLYGNKSRSRDGLEFGIYDVIRKSGVSSIIGYNILDYKNSNKQYSIAYNREEKGVEYQLISIVNSDRRGTRLGHKLLRDISIGLVYNRD